MKYLPPLTLSVRITNQIAAELPIDPVGAALMLAEVYQAEGRLEEAIGLVQRLAEIAPDNPVIRLSLCDLLLEDGDYEGVLEASAGAVNDGDLGVATLHLRGAALFGLGQPGAAAEAFTAALAKTAGRDPTLQTIVRLDRGIAHEGAGNARKARADYERVAATDPANDDARERLSALDTASAAALPRAKPVSLHAAATSDPSEPLRSLRRLLDDGLISQDEYDSKKRDLLARI